MISNLFYQKIRRVLIFQLSSQSERLLGNVT